MLKDSESFSVDSLVLIASNELEADRFGKDNRESGMSSPQDLDSSALSRNLRQTKILCESMSNLSSKDELKVLINESIILFREYQLANGFNRQRCITDIPSSPTSSMFPQLGIKEKFSIMIPQLDHHHRVLELSLLTPTSDSSENSKGRHYCLNLRRISFKPLRRLGGKLSRMVQNIRRYGTFRDLRSKIRALTPTGLGPLPSPLPGYVSASPLVAVNINEEVCRSTDVDHDSTVSNCLRPQQGNVQIKNKEKFTDDIDSYPDDDSRNQDIQLEKRNQAQTRLPSNLQLSSFPNQLTAVTSKKLLLLETATAIGLSLCKAFLIWKHVTSYYWHERAELSPDFSEAPNDGFSFANVISKAAHQGINSVPHHDSSPHHLTVAISSVSILRPNFCGKYHCYTNTSSSYDGNSDGDIICSPTMYSEDGVNKNGGRKSRKIKDGLVLNIAADAIHTNSDTNVESYSKLTTPTRYISNRDTLKNKQTVRTRYSDEGRPQKKLMKLRNHSDPLVDESIKPDACLSPRYHGISPGEETSITQPNKWLGCLNDIDATDCADKDQDEGMIRVTNIAWKFIY